TQGFFVSFIPASSKTPRTCFSKRCMSAEESGWISANAVPLGYCDSLAFSRSRFGISFAPTPLFRLPHYNRVIARGIKTHPFIHVQVHRVRLARELLNCVHPAHHHAATEVSRQRITEPGRRADLEGLNAHPAAAVIAFRRHPKMRVRVRRELQLQRYPLADMKRRRSRRRSHMKLRGRPLRAHRKTPPQSGNNQQPHQRLCAKLVPLHAMPHKTLDTGRSQ